MVSSITKLVLIGAGLAIAAGLAFIQYQFQAGDSPSSQLARSRLGLDKPPLTGNERLQAIIDEAWKNATGQPTNPLTIPTPRRSNAALSIEEQKYEY